MATDKNKPKKPSHQAEGDHDYISENDAANYPSRDDYDNDEPLMDRLI